MVERISRKPKDTPMEKVKVSTTIIPAQGEGMGRALNIPRAATPYSLTPALKEMKEVEYGRFTLRYREKPSDIPGKPAIRWYYVGQLNCAFAEIHESNPKGQYVIYLAHRSTYNVGDWFKSEAELHSFLLAELQA